MRILEELDVIKERIEELSLGEIMRGTRDVLGMKQWKLAALLDINVNHMKVLESNAYKDSPPERTVKLFCDLFGYDFIKVWKQAENRVVRHKKSMQIFGKHPYYMKRISDEENEGLPNSLENVCMHPNKDKQCNSL